MTRDRQEASTAPDRVSAGPGDPVHPPQPGPEITPPPGGPVHPDQPGETPPMPGPEVPPSSPDPVHPETPPESADADLPPAARRALAEAEARRQAAAARQMPKEIGGRDGPEPTRYNDWEKNGIAYDF